MSGYKWPPSYFWTCGFINSRGSVGGGGGCGGIPGAAAESPSASTSHPPHSGPVTLQPQSGKGGGLGGWVGRERAGANQDSKWIDVIRSM